jgi:nucleoside-specific outer membrane channel protein Tsx
MKKTMIAVSILFCISASAQKKDSTKQKKDTLVILSVEQANQLIQDIQIQMGGKADIKTEQWTNDLKMIFGSARIVDADKPKK